MKKAVAYLVPYIEQERDGAAASTKGKIVLATVKGDVHDIGKNIVGVVLQCNNYEVVDLGVMVPAARILEVARELQADIVGLSGLITPSLDEMVHVAREMEREGFDVPLLIGGATTSKVHTAVRIAPEYHGPTIHVTDASRGVTTAGSLRSKAKREAFTDGVRRDYDRIREEYGARAAVRRSLPLTEARNRKFRIEWDGYAPPKPAVAGITTLEQYDLAELSDWIDWTPFFRTWELKGTYPALLDDAVVGEEARKLFADAQALLKRIIDERLFTAKAVLGLFPANAAGDDDIHVFADEARDAPLTVLHHLRQQIEKPPGRPDLCLADFIAPQGSGVADYLGAFAVTAGFGASEVAARFEAEQDDYNAIMAKALADRLAEAFAERLHQRVRTEYWGYAPDETPTNEELIREKYVGIRPAPGYPACPDHSEKRALFELLGVTERIGIELTDHMALMPAASVCGWYFAHPEAYYFGVGKIGRDQVEDYAIRTGQDVATVERWLAPNLAYEREAEVAAS